MTTIPKPADPTAAFYRHLRRLEPARQDRRSAASTVAEYEYDGAKRRSVKKTYTGGQLDETRHFYYTEPSRWQVVEERVDTSTDPDRQFVWGLRYIDDIVLRDRDTTGNGTLDERLYGMQDANWNVTGICDSSGTVQERYAYNPYGTPVVLSPAFGAAIPSSFDWETLFGGYRWDDTVTVFHVRNRVYAANIGSWVQRDRIGRNADLNLYVSERPLLYSDPSGHVWIYVFIIVGLVIVGIAIYYALSSCVPDIPPSSGLPVGYINSYQACIDFCNSLTGGTGTGVIAACVQLCDRLRQRESYTCSILIANAQALVESQVNPTARRHMAEAAVTMCYNQGCNQADCTEIFDAIGGVPEGWVNPWD